MNTVRYHINEDEEIRVCTATDGKCPYGEKSHFNTKEEAEQHLEKKRLDEMAILKYYAPTIPISPDNYDLIKKSTLLNLCVNDARAIIEEVSEKWNRGEIEGDEADIEFIISTRLKSERDIVSLIDKMYPRELDEAVESIGLKNLLGRPKKELGEYTGEYSYTKFGIDLNEIKSRLYYKNMGKLVSILEEGNGGIMFSKEGLSDLSSQLEKMSSTHHNYKSFSGANNRDRALQLSKEKRQKEDFEQFIQENVYPLNDRTEDEISRSLNEIANKHFNPHQKPYNFTNVLPEKEVQEYLKEYGYTNALNDVVTDDMPPVDAAPDFDSYVVNFLKHNNLRKFYSKFRTEYIHKKERVRLGLDDKDLSLMDFVNQFSNQYLS